MYKTRIPKSSSDIAERKRNKFEGHFLTARNQEFKYLLSGQVQSPSDLHVK